MLTVEESVCCKELERVQQKMEEANLIGCITDHPGFQSVCLDVWVLQTAYFAYRQGNGHLPQNDVHE